MNDISTHLIATEKALKAASEAIACPTMTQDSYQALKQALGQAQASLDSAQQWADDQIPAVFRNLRLPNEQQGRNVKVPS